MLAEAPLMRIAEPGCVNTAIESNYGIDTAVRTKSSQANRLTVGPLCNGRRRELREAVEAASDLADKELPPMIG